MFHSQTLFIVGAGASCEFGLPSGADIKGKIAHLIDIRFADGYSLTSGDPQIVDCFRRIAHQDEQLSGNINPIIHKCWLVRDALPAAISIDNLLHAHQGDIYTELAGKLGIVKAVLEAERASTLKPNDRYPPKIDLKGAADTWLMYFFKIATEGITRSNLEKLFENVSIVCFNYDRCIEWFIPHAIQAYYGVDEAHALELLKNLTILHPYGTVGPLQKVSFGSTETNIVDAAKSILTFSEGLSDEALIGRIRNQVEFAETIVFLGFAFHPMNVSLLTPGDETITRKIFATSFGLSKADESVIEDDILGMVHKDRILTNGMGYIEANPSYIPEFSSLRCADFFATYFRALSAPVS